MPVVVGRIEPHVFKPGEASRLLGGIGAPGEPDRDQATRMANAAQTLWDAIRDCSPDQLEELQRFAPEIGAALLGVRRVMVG